MKRPSGMVILTGLQWVISVADGMLIVLLQMMVFDLTRSTFNIMLLVICELIPMLLFGAGYVRRSGGCRRFTLWAWHCRWWSLPACWRDGIGGRPDCRRCFDAGLAIMLCSLLVSGVVAMRMATRCGLFRRM